MPNQFCSWIRSDNWCNNWSALEAFRIYILNKPNKHSGPKVSIMCDATSTYMIDADPHAGKSTDTGEVPLGQLYVKKLWKTIHGSNRNITCDNGFTSVSLAKMFTSNSVTSWLRWALFHPISGKSLNNWNTRRSRLVGSSMFCWLLYRISQNLQRWLNSNPCVMKMQ